MVRRNRLCFQLFLVGGLALSFVRTTRGGEGAQTVAVLPLSCLGATPTSCEALRRSLSEELEKNGEIKIVPENEVDAAVEEQCGTATAWWSCLEHDKNLFEVGGRLGANIVFTGKLAAIGEAHVLKLKAADCSSRTVFSEVIEMAHGGNETVLPKFMLLQKRIFPESQREEAWYQKWPVWAIAGVVVATVVGAVLIGSSVSNSEESWDYRLSLP